MMPELEKLKGYGVPTTVEGKKYARSLNVNLDIPPTIDVKVGDKFEVFHLTDEKQNEFIIFKKVKT